MLEFSGQMLELSLPVGRETKKPPRPPVVSGMDIFIDYLHLRAFFKAIFYIISSSRRSPEELFLRSGNCPASVCPSNCPSVNVSCYRISSKTTGRIFIKLGQNVPLSV